jgi:hypothetical protein
MLRLVKRLLKWLYPTKGLYPMATIADLIARVEGLKALADDQATKSDASHTAADFVATTTQTEGARVAQAQADAQVSINAAQEQADDAKARTDEATAKLDAEIEGIIADAKSLEK